MRPGTTPEACGSVSLHPSRNRCEPPLERACSARVSATGPQSGSDELPEPGEIVGGRYRIEQVLGSGATGVVYEGSHQLTGQRVAIKWLRPDLAASDALTARFLREARAACAIDHPNVVTVSDAGRDRGSLFLVMELLRGESLSAFLDRGPHAPEVVVATLMPALRGVAAAHEHGIIHRDLKPDNVFLPEPRKGWPAGAKVLDFGISKLKQPVDGRELTHSGVFLGSPLYMAPEQILEPSGVDARADVYSIGVMLYEALSGRVPFEADALHELFRKVMAETPASLSAERPEIPIELERIVLRAMARDRRSRPQSVRALAIELEPFGPGVTFEQPAPDDRGERTRFTSMAFLEGGRTLVARPPAGSRDTDPHGASDLGATRVEVPIELSGSFTTSGSFTAPGSFPPPRSFVAPKLPEPLARWVAKLPPLPPSVAPVVARAVEQARPHLARPEVLALLASGLLLGALVLGCLLGAVIF